MSYIKKIVAKMRSKLVLFLLSVLVILCFSHAAVAESTDIQDLICHTANPSECYPRVFVPSKEFQIIRDNQALPKGLHIRMNMQTGLKEAKLYDNSEDVEVNAVEAFPDDEGPQSPRIEIPSALIEASSDELDFDIPAQPFFQHVLQTADQGPIRPPVGSVGDATTYDRNIEIIKQADVDSEELRNAMNNLEDLSHDIYWGLVLAKDAEAVESIKQWVGTRETGTSGIAARLLGTAIQNNPAALEALLSHRREGDVKIIKVESVLWSLRFAKSEDDISRLIYFISALCRDSRQIMDFLDEDGFYRQGVIASIFTKGNQRIREKIANFISDHLVDSMSDGMLSSYTARLLSPGELGLHRGPLEYSDPWIITHPVFGDDGQPAKGSESASMCMMSQLVYWAEAFRHHLEEEPRADNSTPVANAHEKLVTLLKDFECELPDNCQWWTDLR